MRKIGICLITMLLVGCERNAPELYNCGGFGVSVTDKELRWASKTFRFHEENGVFRKYQNNDDEDQIASFDTVLGKLWIYSKKEFSSGKFDTGVKSDCVNK